MKLGDPLELMIWYVVFVFSATLHEAAHAWAAKQGGDLTAYYGGQVSLDPVPHMRREPMGMIFLPLISLVMNGWPLGWASAPYDANWAAHHPRRAAWMALAGPASNFGLMLFAALLIRIGMIGGVFDAPASISPGDLAGLTMSAKEGFWSNAAMGVSVLFSLNLILAVLNLFPMPPLDGSGVMGLFMKEVTAVKFQNFARQPGLSMIGLMVIWFFFWPIFQPILLLAVNLLYPGQSYGFH